MKPLVLALLASAGFSSAVHAQSPASYPSPYIGVGVSALDQTSGPNARSDARADSNKIGARLFGGVDFNSTWGLEAGYARLGRYSADYDYTNPGVVRISYRNSAVYVAAKASMPVNEQLSLYAKLGATRMTLRTSSDPDVFSYKEHRNDPYGALGVQFKLTDKVALTAEYERFGKERSVGVKPGVLTAAAKYSF
jgi:opacity protein-like surface antigen